ncbi:MAG: nucleotide exchange factor GrpE [Deltaproteobacteria bacterium]|nr:nucleotide exchange factor GrpE [Deltaproteobacteria bacterium]
MSQADNPGTTPRAAAPADPEAPEEQQHQQAPGEAVEAADLLTEKTREAQENYEKYLRLAAELDNLKKRQERERSELVQFANENLLKELLPVLDNLERALEHGSNFDAPEGLLEGLELVQQDFLKVLARFGVSPVDCVGQPFNPAFHHAVMEEEAPEAPDHTVLKELQRGYLLHTRLLRPAMVVVSRNPQSSSTRVDVKV